MNLDKNCSKCRTRKPLGCFNQRARSKDGLRGECRECQSSYNSDRYSKNPAFYKAKVAERLAADRDRINEGRRGSYRCNAAEILERQRAYFQKTKPERLKYRREWARKNPDLERAYLERSRVKNRPARAARTAKRNADKLKATPKWVDLVALKKVYAEAAKRTAQTGVPHHVDHIVPLRHQLVCGLHVPANLHVLPALLNVLKSNGFAPYEE